MFSLLKWQEAPEQRQAEILSSRGVVINGCPTGRGKTYMAAATLARTKIPALIICPKAVTTSWGNVLGAAGVPVAGVRNWEKLKTGNYGWWDPEAGWWKFSEPTAVVVDEVHRGATGIDSQITEMLAKLKAYQIPKILMSATVACTPLALRGVGFLCGLSPWRREEFYRWCLNLGCVYKKHGTPRGPAYHVALPSDVSGTQIMARVGRALSEFLVTLNEDDPSFPETVITSKLFDVDESVTAEVALEYKKLAEAVKDRSPDTRAIQTRARQRAEIVKVPILKDLANDVVESGGSAVIFVNYLETIRLLQLALGPDRVCQIYGDVKDRDNQKELFQSNRRHIMLAQVQTGGLGIDLHDVRHERPRSTFISPSYNAPDMVQCLGRAHRAKGTKSYQMFVLLAGTLEERIHEALVRKQFNIEALTQYELMGLE